MGKKEKKAFLENMQKVARSAAMSEQGTTEVR